MVVGTVVPDVLASGRLNPCVVLQALGTQPGAAHAPITHSQIPSAD